MVFGRKVTEFLAAITQAQSRIVAISCAVVCVLTVADYALLSALAYFDVPRTSIRMENAIVTGCIGAALTWALLNMLALRRRYLGAQIKVIADLNHELRNALDVILSSGYLPEGERPHALSESANRIDRALTQLMREVAAHGKDVAI
jgi:signal transduction histidine kinase